MTLLAPITSAILLKLRPFLNNVIATIFCFTLYYSGLKNQDKILRILLPIIKQHFSMPLNKHSWAFYSQC